MKAPTLKQIAAIVAAIISLVIGYLVVANWGAISEWFKSKLPGQGGSGGGAAVKAGTVIITASNPKDPYLRDWHVQDASGKSIKVENHTSGQSMSVELTPGNYVFIIGQTGGDAYGKYSGTVGTLPFDSVDNDEGFSFTVA
jgi:hypothetical protein